MRQRALQSHVQFFRLLIYPNRLSATQPSVFCLIYSMVFSWQSPSVLISLCSCIMIYAIIHSPELNVCFKCTNMLLLLFLPSTFYTFYVLYLLLSQCLLSQLLLDFGIVMYLHGRDFIHSPTL